jgi:virginiamycin A acetyltransferase
MRLHPVSGQERVVFLKPLVRNPQIQVGDYTYYDDPDAALEFERDAFLYGYGPERLIIGRYCAIASGVRFIMSGANHADLGPSTFPFGIWWDWPVELVTEHARAIMAGDPAELERIAERHGLLRE